VSSVGDAVERVRLPMNLEISTDERNARSFERTIEKTREEEARFSSCLRPFAVVYYYSGVLFTSTAKT
jgi:hypothetical protein